MKKAIDYLDKEEYLSAALRTTAGPSSPNFLVPADDPFANYDA